MGNLRVLIKDLIMMQEKPLEKCTKNGIKKANVTKHRFDRSSALDIFYKSQLI